MRASLQTLVATVVLVLGAGGLLACKSDEERLASHIERANEYLEEDDRRSELLELRNALQLDPKSAEVNYRIARSLMSFTRWEDATYFFREAHRLDPERSDVALDLAKMLMGTELAEAESLIEGVIEREPDNVTAYIRLSELALGRVDVNEGLSAALTAVELDPQSAEALLHLGMVHRARIRAGGLEPGDRSEHEAALSALDRGIATGEKQGDEPMMLVRGRVERARTLASWPERRAEAAGAFREAVEATEPGSMEERLAMEATTTYATQADDAQLRLWALERRTAGTPEDLAAWLEIAQIVQADDGTGVDVLVRMVEANPGDARAQAAHGRMLASWEGVPRGIAYLEAAAGEAEEPGVLWAVVSELHFAARDLDGARGVLGRLESLDPASDEAQLAAARVKLLEGEVVEAADALRVMAGSVESLSVLTLLATAEFRLGNYSTVLTLTERAKALAPGSSPALLRVEGRAHAAMSQWDAALRAFWKLARADARSMNPTDSVWIAHSLYATGKRKAARERLDAVMAIDDPPVDAVLAFARWEGRAEPERARELLYEALSEYPTPPGSNPILSELSRIATAQGEPGSVVPDLDRALEQDPDSVALLTLRSRVRAQMGELDAGIEDAQRAFDLAPHLPGTGRLLATLLGRAHRMGEAIVALETEAGTGNLSAEGMVLLASLQGEAGRPERAVELLEEALREKPDMVQAKNDLAYQLASSGREFDRALEMARETRQQMPNSHAVADTLGFVLLKKGLPEAATEQFLVAIELAEGSSSPLRYAYQYHLGLGYKEQGRTAEAIAAFEAALAPDQDFPDADAARSELEALRAEG